MPAQSLQIGEKLNPPEFRTRVPTTHTFLRGAACNTMSNLPRSPTAYQPRASPDGRFPMYADEEMASPPMCGHGILTKLLRKSPGRQTDVPPIMFHVDDSSNESKSCLNPAKQLHILRKNRYEEVTGPLHSPDTQSSSGSEKSKEDTTPLVQNDAGTVLPYLVQFDPNDLQEVMGEQTEDSTYLNRVKQRHLGHNRRQPSWSTSLPVVTEEKSTDSDDLRDEKLRSKSKSAASYHESSSLSDDPTSQSALINLPPQEKNDMLIGMRHLVLKQQMKLAELTEQNSQYRREIRSYQHTLLGMKEDQMTQKDKIGLLTIEKETFEAEAIWLRKKMKEPQSSPESSVVYEDSLASQFQRLMTDQPDQHTYDRKEDNGEFNFQEFTKGLMSDNFLGNILGNKNDANNRTVDQMEPTKDEMTSPRARDPSRAPAAREEREDIHSVGSHLSFEIRSSAYTDSSKEEVALFKSRLDTIQQRRMQRQKGRNINGTSATRSVVRFDDAAKAKAPAAGRE